MSEPNLINEGIDGEVVACVRDAARSVTGGNYTFAIDDIDVMCLLAQAAVDGGLADGILHGSVLQKAQTLSVARAIAALSLAPIEETSEEKR